MTRKGFPEVGHVEGGADDLWLALGWSPQAAAPPSADSGAAVRDSAHIDSAAAHGSRIYLQVSSSRNPTWAAELADKIRSAGLPASVLPPARGEELHRVVLGPFATREAAEEAGRKVGMPSFIITASDSGR
jgi:cell division septation protein DedD